MTGIRVFAVYLGLVWFFLGHASFLDKMDRAEREAELMEQAEKDLEFLEAEWKPQMEEAEEALTDLQAKIAELAEEDEFAKLRLNSAIEVAEMTLKARQEAKAAALKAAQDHDQELERAELAHGLDSCTWGDLGGYPLDRLRVARSASGMGRCHSTEGRRVLPPTPEPEPEPEPAAPPVADEDEIELDDEDPSDVG